MGADLYRKAGLAGTPAPVNVTSRSPVNSRRNSAISAWRPTKVVN
ncbi:hypothetical protein BZL30_5636 [Mycobacterium kansasii]|uniref:Uncharacterized protein n=1 Tax=Mycobacterium kansasii TaxID=1768 RepID=A0A1V3WXN2_MYCKA|nr:hypothetical protein BZL30_5636 [Mycobacterium kansasii]